MKTEKIKIAADIKSNIEVGSILVREVDAADEHRSDDYSPTLYYHLTIKTSQIKSS
jgi:hypothetical protein